MCEFDEFSAAHYILQNQPMEKKKLHLLLHYANCWHTVLYGQPIITPLMFELQDCPRSIWLDINFPHIPDDRLMFTDDLEPMGTGQVNEPPRQLKGILNSLLDEFEDLNGNLMEFYWNMDGSPLFWERRIFQAGQRLYCIGGEQRCLITFS